MEESIIDVDLIKGLRSYLQAKTKKLYFKDIKAGVNNITVTCPFHKDGQENKPSANIRITSNDRASVGLFNCFTCGEAMPLNQVIEKILGDLYNEEDVEAKFNLKALITKSQFIKPKKEVLFKLDNNEIIKESILKNYRYYHNYLAQRNITIETANKYDIGYDKLNDHITFPIKNIYNECLAVGRRSIKQKIYRYPNGFQKPLYGVYELPKLIRYLWVVEGPFNLYSLYQWGKTGVALLGTGTEKQYRQLLTIDVKGYVLSLDPDDAGRHGTLKLGTFLTENKKQVFVALIPEGKDVNDLTAEEFHKVEVISFKEWYNIYN